MTKPAKPSALYDATIEAVLDRLYGEADRQFGALFFHYLPKLPGLFFGKGIQWDQTKTDFYCDKYILIERDQGEFYTYWRDRLTLKPLWNLAPRLGFQRFI